MDGKLVLYAFFVQYSRDMLIRKKKTCTRFGPIHGPLRLKQARGPVGPNSVGPLPCFPRGTPLSLRLAAVFVIVRLLIHRELYPVFSKMARFRP